MAEEDDSQKTEEPSDKKLSRAKEKGQVAQSQEIKSWLILLGGAGILIALGPFMARGIRNVSLPFIESPQDIPMDFPHMHKLVADLSFDVGIILAPILGLLFVLAIFSNVAQFGLIFAPEKIQFDLSKLSLVAGVKRMVSSRALMEFLKGILKLVAVGAV